QNHMAWYIMRHAAENDIPVQFHTALIDPCIDYTDPYSLVNFLQDDVGYNTKIVLLHAGYPLFTHAKAMAMAAKPLSQNNVYIDISGRVMFANDPNVIARMLRDFLDVPALWGKLLYGSDTLLGERFLFTAAHTARDAVYKATSAMLQEGMVTGELAIKIARDILRNNAIRLYKLPLEII
ncbi:amidohydrolase family protein, partial [Ruminococcaceae bacterium OttesenSCG-928-O06]|nr:amidohydrolase family protein [Ruminococcaceae bacterium OttesenSCG-928-O06]